MGRKIIDLTGKKFGILKVIKRNYPDQNRHLMWLCKCKCGIEKIIYGCHLKSGHTKSCGCLLGLKHIEYGLANMRRLFRGYKYNAKRRGYKFELTEEQFAEITKKDCHYCGAKPNNIYKFDNAFGDYIYNGIDRIDNDEGYTMENTVPCCKKCNKKKGALTLPEFKDWIEKVYIKLFLEG